jgi:type IV pilus assembly protein PilB
VFGNQGKPQKPGQRRTSSSHSANAEPATLENTLKRVLESQEATAESLQAAADAMDTGPEVDAPLVQLVNAILIEAVRINASDIHIEPFETFLRVRLRVDGVLQEMQKIPHRLSPAITSRLKIMAGLDICEKRIPQDGCIKFRSGTVEADLRLSTLPSLFGEKIVMRVMSSAAVNNDLSKLGIPDHQLKIIREAVNRPDGLVLVTGPTGSGKTTTLYAALNELNDISVSVFTAEDPVEGTLLGVTQSQVNATVGYTFAQILRSLLRQDPDVILVGEIRDQETAEISIKASLTGHLVLSTLHTNCAVSTISRLLNMGIAPYLITSSVSCVIAQRLVRRVCTECVYERPATEDLLARLGKLGETLRGVNLKFGKGCKKCNGTGYKGRAPIYEVLSLSDNLRQMILHGTSREDMKLAARREGMQTLRDSGIALVRQGITTLDEVLGVTNEDTPLDEVPGESPGSAPHSLPASHHITQHQTQPQLPPQVAPQQVIVPHAVPVPAQGSLSTAPNTAQHPNPEPNQVTGIHSSPYSLVGDSAPVQPILPGQPTTMIPVAAATYPSSPHTTSGSPYHQAQPQITPSPSDKPTDSTEQVDPAARWKRNKV